MLLDPPPAPLLDEREHSYFCELWVLFPQSAQPTRVQHSLVFMAICKLFVIVNAVVVRSYGEGRAAGSLSFSEAWRFQENLTRWHKVLPAELQADQIVFPAHLKLQ